MPHGAQVWIGAMAIILPNTRIGKGSLVAAGAVVQGEYPPFSVIAGRAPPPRAFPPW